MCYTVSILNKTKEYNNLEKAYNKERQELENKYIQELQAKEALNQKVKELTQDRRDKEGLIATLRAQIRNLNESSKDAQKASKELNDRIQELETEQTIREQNAVNAQKNYEKELSSIKAKLQESDALILQSNQKISQNIETIKSKEQEINTMKDRIKELQTKKPQSSSDDLFEVLLNFEKVLFNINGNKGAGIVKVEKFKKDPNLTLDLKDTDFYTLRIDTKDNSRNNDLYISISKYLVVNRYDKTSYEIIPSQKKETYRFKIVQPKAMTADEFKDQMKALNTLLKSTTNFNDKYKLKIN